MWAAPHWGWDHRLHQCRRGHVPYRCYSVSGTVWVMAPSCPSWLCDLCCLPFLRLSSFNCQAEQSQLPCLLTSSADFCLGPCMLVHVGQIKVFSVT